jgi:glucan phosphoethanolaminetransferase (alkaline phosphatase superfamily)
VVNVVTLIILIVLAILFTVLAIRNWKRTIGAGPTILIIGTIVIMMLIPIKWTEYQQKLREYDACVARVERSQEVNKFNDVLINIIVRETGALDIAEELKKATPAELTLEDYCPEEPTFIGVFFTSQDDVRESFNRHGK